MVPWKVYRLCRSDTTVTSEIARDNTQDPTKVFNKLFESNQSDKNAEDSVYKQKDVLQMAHECGKWGTSEPSTLFLQVNNCYTVQTGKNDRLLILKLEDIPRCIELAGKGPKGRSGLSPLDGKYRSGSFDDYCAAA